MGWDALVAKFPGTCKAMLDAVPPTYRLEGTGFTKVTIAINNPTPLHFDDNNEGLTFLFSIDVDGGLVGGSHIICGLDDEAAVLVHDSPVGVITIGDYRRVLHSNFATRCGRRFILTAYCSTELLKRVNPK